MNLKTICHVSVLSACIALASAAGAQTTKPLDTNATKDSVDAEHKAAIAACKSLSGNAKDVCRSEADGQRKVALAELKFRRSGRPADQLDLDIAKAEAAYDTAKERCDDLSGDAKSSCRKEAKAAEERAKADAKARVSKG